MKMSVYEEREKICYLSCQNPQKNESFPLLTPKGPGFLTILIPGGGGGADFAPLGSWMRIDEKFWNLAHT